MLFVKQVLAFVIAVSAVIVICCAIPSVATFSFTVTGYAGWIASIGGIIFAAFSFGFISGMVESALGVTEKTKPEFQRVVEDSIRLYVLPIGFTVGWMIVPSAFTFSSPFGGWLLIGIVGLGRALERFVQRRIKAAHLAKSANNNAKG